MKISIFAICDSLQILITSVVYVHKQFMLAWDNRCPPPKFYRLHFDGDDMVFLILANPLS